jgi:hypothetical protein
VLAVDLDRAVVVDRAFELEVGAGVNQHIAVDRHSVMVRAVERGHVVVVAVHRNDLDITAVCRVRVVGDQRAAFDRRVEQLHDGRGVSLGGGDDLTAPIVVGAVEVELAAAACFQRAGVDDRMPAGIDDDRTCVATVRIDQAAIDENERAVARTDISGAEDRGFVDQGRHMPACADDVGMRASQPDRPVSAERHMAVDHELRAVMAVL